MSLRDEILAAKDIKEEPVSIPEWGGGKFTVREMNGQDRFDFYAACMVDGKFSGAVSPFAVVALSLYDGTTGERIFTVDDIPALKTKSGAVIERVSAIGMRLSGLSETEVEAAEKNSSTVIPNSSSTSRSRKNSE